MDNVKFAELTVDSEVFDFYWYCLTKNAEYINDYIHFKEIDFPVLSQSNLYISTPEKSPVLLDEPLIKGENSYFDISNVSDEFIEKFYISCVNYYAFRAKWRVVPTNYLYESRLWGMRKKKWTIKIYSSNEIGTPEELKQYGSRYDMDLPSYKQFTIASNQYSLKQVRDRANAVVETIETQYKDDMTSKKMKNKSTSSDVMKRSLMSFAELFYFQFDVESSASDISYNEFVFDQIVSTPEDTEVSAKEFFKKKNNHDEIWPSSIKDIYNSFGFDTSDVNKYSKQRSADFKLALNFIRNPHNILSIYSTF